MIHYQLRCGQDHEFDGWFKDSQAFDQQSERGLVACPTCGDVRVGRAMMAPALAKRQTAPARPASNEPPSGAAPASAAPASDQPTSEAVTGKLPDHVRAMLQRLRAEVERNCHYVGNRFAEEARRIHRGESEHREIYGETTPDQAEALADEGIAVSRVPWVPRADG